MERPMSIVLTDETTPAMNNDPHQCAAPEDTVVAETRAAPEPPNQPPVSSSQERNADARSSSADHPMRLPSFDEVCPHVRDHIIPMNGGHFNVDHYLRVLRAKVETDESIAMTLTAFGQGKMGTRPHRPTLWHTHPFGGAP
jgi:hypothetical protein